MLVPLLALGPQGDALVARIEAVRYPKWVPGKERDKAFMAKYWPAMAKANGERNGLILQLLKDDPNHPKTPFYMRRRWESLETGDLGDGREYAKRILADVDRVLAGKPPKAVAQLGEAMKIQVRGEYGLDDSKDAEAKLEAFLAKSPSNAAGETAIRGWIARLAPSEVWRGYAKYLEYYPDGPYALAARGVLRQHDGVGKPFELAFTDPVSGKPFDLKDHRGQVVALDFWATWCGPCVAKMPEVKRVLDAYGPRGLVVVGVSLDEKIGGLDKMRAFLAKKGYAWPQYFGGDGWNSPFSRDWGIQSIPTVFLIDRKGILRQTDARDLERDVGRLLAEPF